MRDRETKEVGEFWHQITVDMETLSEIMAYVHKWNMKGFLFPSHLHSNKPLSRQAVSLKQDKLAEGIGLTGSYTLISGVMVSRCTFEERVCLLKP